MIDAVIDGRTYRFDDEDTNSIVGHGGEADVFRFQPHPDFMRRHGNKVYVFKFFREDTDVQRRAAHERHAKLRNFPSGLPENAITPTALAYDRWGTKVIGYVMAFVPNAVPLIEFKTRKYRKEHGITAQQINRILANLYDLVSAIHARGVVMGDFNDKNVLVGPNFEVYLIDTDSLQYDGWECPAFVVGFVDPLICARPEPGRPKSFNELRKIHDHNASTDWYAFTVIAFQLLVLAHPYTGGLHNPAPNEGPRRKNVQRIHRRLSVFHPRVGLPTTIVPFEHLPEKLLQHFIAVFTHDHRGKFPRELLSPKLWVICPACRTEHGRSKCPSCGAPGIADTATQSRRLDGRILTIAYQGGKARCVYHGSGAYRREDGNVLWKRSYDERLSAFVAGDRTVIASGASFALFNGHKPPERRATQCVYGRTTVAANSRHVYWISESCLVRDDAQSGTVTIGTIAPHSTSVWVGERFGLALVQAGVLTRILAFDAEKQGLQYSYDLPLEFGTVVDAQCVINNDFAWLKVSSRGMNGIVTHRCYAFDAYARLRGTAVADQGKIAWLDQLSSSALPVRDKLIVPVRRTGMVQIAIKGVELRQEKTHGGTEPLTKDVTVGLCLASGDILHASQDSLTRITAH